MKKKYEIPQTEVVIINASTCLLQASSVGINSTDEPIDAGNAAAPELDDFEF